jgi:hypothetical protein
MESELEQTGTRELPKFSDSSKRKPRMYYPVRNLLWGVGLAVALAVVIFALIFVFYSQSPPSVTGPPPTGEVLSNRSFGIWMTEFSGSGDHQNSAYTGEKIDPTQIGFSLPFKFDQPLPWSVCFTTKRLSKDRCSTWDRAVPIIHSGTIKMRIRRLKERGTALVSTPRQPPGMRSVSVRATLRAAR